MSTETPAAPPAFGHDPAKRVFDLVAAGLALVVLAPVMGIVALLVWHRLGSPVMYRQVRAGRLGQPFTLYKFRSMREATDAAGRPLPDGDRLTPFGQWLRRTSLDELPGFWNVLRGDMSIVGPRPLLTSYVTRYSPRQARRLEVRPGITGLAQVSGRNALTWEERFELDVRYVDEHDLRMDLVILLQTVGAVLRRDGVQAANHATMSEFLGPPPTSGDGHDSRR